MKPLLQPARPLRHGDTVATVAPSSALSSDQQLREGLALLQSWGLEPLPQTVAERQWGYLAGRDAERRADLHQAAPLLACARGGWGAARLLERPIAWSPGWLLGFSDITALLLARLAAGYDGSVHGPLLTTLATEPEWSRERLRRLLFGEPVPDLKGRAGGGGQVSGPLLVVNLTVASHLLGSPWMPDLNGAILIVEDVGEEPYRIDRMLTHWRLCGALQALAGIGFGHFAGCDADGTDKQGFALEEVLLERTADLKLARVFDLPLGHVSGNAALPLGRQACLDGDRGRLSLHS